MPIIFKTEKGWDWDFIFPRVPGSEFGSTVSMSGYFLVLEALWRNI